MADIVKESIHGVILVISCHKHQHTRLEKYKLPKTEYAGWKVIYILGNPLLSSEYQWDSSNQMTIKCEDSYIHLMKKVALSIKILYDLYDMEEGILRCGDDLVFDESRLTAFLRSSTKSDYMGYVHSSEGDGIRCVHDTFMVDYFNSHPNELTYPVNGIPYSLGEMQQFCYRPVITTCGGVVVYLSNRSCHILVDHMNAMNYNVFQKDEPYGYPYMIEDVGVAYILRLYHIRPTYARLYADGMESFLSDQAVLACHTNEFK
jgi:hypothetical protein